MRHIQPDQLITYLNLGKPIEQWLDPVNDQESVIIRWIIISPQRDGGYLVLSCEVYDVGSEDFIDVVEFESVDPDELFVTARPFESSEDALSYSEKTYGCTRDRLVNEGMIQYEYLDYVRSKPN